MTRSDFGLQMSVSGTGLCVWCIVIFGYVVSTDNISTSSDKTTHQAFKHTIIFCISCHDLSLKSLIKLACFYYYYYYYY